MSASDFLAHNWRDLLQAFDEHLALVVIAMSLALAIGIPTGILLSHRPRLQRPIIGLANIFQTVPSLALFGFLMPLLGLGAKNAIAALVLYSLLPLIRNTVTGISGIDPVVREAALAMGMTDRQILWQVELPLASSVILAGVRVATVLCVGVATIASFIAAGGLGVYIQNGLRATDNVITLAGAVPAALLALSADAVLGAYQRMLERRNGLAPAPKVPERRTAFSSSMQRVAFVPLALLLGAGAVGAAFGARSLFGGASSSSVPNGTPVVGTLTVGSKDFTESKILAEILSQMASERGIQVARKDGLGGKLPHLALLQHQIDCYPEYTGTAFAETLHHKPISDVRAVYDQVKREYADQFHVAVSAPLGFSNGFAILVRGKDARAHGLKTISQMARYAPGWVAGFGPDFISRADGYPGWSRTYDLHFARPPLSMDLSLINRALAGGKVDVIAGNETDGLIPALDLVQLEDDRHYFPPYQAVYLVGQNALKRLPPLAEVLQKLDGAISTAEMRRLNYEVDGHHRDVVDVVKEWRRRRGF